MEYSIIIHLAGVFFFGISSALIGAKARLDLFGVIFVACVGALGGGTVRDLFIGHYPLSWVQDPRYIAAVLAGTGVALIFRNKLVAIKNLIFVVDSLGIGFFMVSGIRLCLHSGLNPAISLVFGVLSVILGGLLRDVICNEVPQILRKELIATAALAGGGVFLLVNMFQSSGALSTIFGISTVLAIRVLGKKYRWQLPVVGL
jgi:uncharacterized membrane protein YeiH